MKKLRFISILMVCIFTITGCGSVGGVKLKESEILQTLKSNGELIIEAYMEEDQAVESFGIDIDDEKEDIADDLQNFFDDQDIDVEVSKIKSSKDTIKFTLTFEDYEDMYGIDADVSLEDSIEDAGLYEDIDAFSEEFDFVSYKNGDDIDAEDLSDYGAYKVISVFGGGGGAYFKVPGKIALASDIDYEKISNDTIYVESDEDGIVIYK